MVPLSARRGQHPDEVCRAVCRSIDRWYRRPEAALIARSVLAPYAPTVRDVSGAWVGPALQRWAERTTFYREPAHGAGEIVASLPIVIETGGGDCDDIAAAAGTMAAALGIPVAVGRVQLSPSFAHVVCGVGPNWTGAAGPWTIVDAEKHVPPDAPGVRWHLPNVSP